MGPFIPKLQGEFAEFLSHESLERLSILNPTTCVRLRYELPYSLFLEVNYYLRFGRSLSSAGYSVSPQIHHHYVTFIVWQVQEY